MALSDILKMVSTATAFIPGAQGISSILGAGATVAGVVEKKKASSQEPDDPPYLKTDNDNNRATDLRTGDPFEDMDKYLGRTPDLGLNYSFDFDQPSTKFIREPGREPGLVSEVEDTDKGYNFDKYLGRTPFDDLGLDYSFDFDQPSTKFIRFYRDPGKEPGKEPGLVSEAKTANTLSTIATGISGASALGSVVASLNAGEPDVAPYVKAPSVTLDKDTSDFENAAEAERDRRFNTGVRFMSDMGMSPSLASSSLYGLTNRSMGETRATSEQIRREADTKEKEINSRINLYNSIGMNQFNRFEEELQLKTNLLNAESVSSGLATMSDALIGYGEARIGNKMYSDAIRQKNLLEGWF